MDAVCTARDAKNNAGAICETGPVSFPVRKKAPAVKPELRKETVFLRDSDVTAVIPPEFSFTLQA